MAKGRRSVTEESLSRTNWIFLIGGICLVLLFLLTLCSRPPETDRVPLEGPNLDYTQVPLLPGVPTVEPFEEEQPAQAELLVSPDHITFEKIKIGSLAKAVLTITADKGGVEFLNVPALATQQDGGFTLSGNCFSFTSLEKGKKCQIEVSWEPQALVHYDNEIVVRWRNDNTIDYQPHTMTIPVSGASTDEKDCVVCPQQQQVETKSSITAITPVGLEIGMPPGTMPGIVKKDTGEIEFVVDPRKIPVGLNNQVLGIIEEGSRKVLDADGKQIGLLLGDDTIVDGEFKVIGAALPVDVAVLDAQGKKIGETKLDKTDFKVVDDKGMSIGVPRVDSSVVDYDGHQIGMIIPSGTALDLNGKYLGLILPTGEVLSADQKILGHLHQNGMVVNDQGEILGAVTPRGVGVSTGCRSFKAVAADGKVTDDYGQVVGRVLLDRAIVDSDFNEVGAVIPQGLIIDETGRIQGYMNAGGKAVDKTGTLIGCAGPDGMVKAGRTVVGGIMKKGMVVGRACEVIGSVYPNGTVMNQAVEPIGYVRPDGYVVTNAQDIIGVVVPFGTAVAEGCRMLGMISASGQIVGKDGMAIGCMNLDKSVVNYSNERIGQVTPQGPIFQQGALLGRVRLDGYVVDKNGKVLDCALQKKKELPGFDGAGVVLNDSGLPTSWTVMSGKCYSESNELLGDVAFNGWVSNSQGRMVGFIAPNGLIVAKDGEILGTYSSGTGRTRNQEGVDFARIMPDLTVLDKAGERVLGALIPMDSVGVAFDASVLGHIRPSGFVAENENLRAKVLADGSVVDASGRLVGHIMPAGPVVSVLGKPLGWATANGEVFSKGTRIGQVAGNGLALAPDGHVLGRVWMPMSVVANGSGIVGGVVPKAVNVDSDELAQLSAYDKNGNYIGLVSPFGTVLGTGGSLLGRAVPVGMVFNFTHNLIGWVSFSGQVVDSKGRVLGTPSQNGLVMDLEGKAIGFVLEKGVVTDKMGALLGNVAADGSVVNSSGTVVGFVSGSPFVYDQKGGIVGRRWPLGVGVDAYGSLLGLLSPVGGIMDKKTERGRMALDGRILDESYNLVGSFVPLGQAVLADSEKNAGVIAENATVVTASGKTVGNVVGTDYVMRNGELVGRVMQGSLFVNDMASSKTLGQAEYNSEVYRWATMRPIGTVSVNGFMADSNKKILGGLAPLGLPQTVNLSIAGAELFNGSVILGDKIYGGATASGVLVSQDGITGQITPLTAVVDKNGLFVGAADGTGGIMNKNGAKIASQMAFGAALSSETEWVGGALKTGFVVNDFGQKVGAVAADGTVIGAKNSFKGRVLPDGSVAGVPDEKVYNSMPYIGHTVVQGIPVGYNDSVLGRTTVMGDVVDSADKKVYSVLDDGSVLGTTTPLAGRVLPFGNAFGCQGPLGVMNENRRIINARGEDVGFVDDSGFVLERSEDQFSWNKDRNLHVVGALVPEQLVVNNACQVIGQTTPTGEVVDGAGNTVARLSVANKNAVDTSGKVVGHVVRYGPVMSFAQQAPEGASTADRGIQYLGRTLPNGMVVNDAGVVIGCADHAGVLVDANGGVLGRVVSRGPVYGASNTPEAGKMIGRVDARGRVIDVHGNTIGMADGHSVVYQETGERIGLVVPLDNIKFINADGILNGYMDSEMVKRDRDGKVLYQYDPCSGKMSGPQGEELADNYDPDKVYLYDLADRIIAQLIGCDLFKKDGQTQLGSLLSDGTIRDINNDIYGTVGFDNKVYNPDGSLKGEFRGAVDLRKCGLAAPDPLSGSSRTICISGRCVQITNNDIAIDPVTKRRVGILRNNRIILDAPNPEEDVDRPLPPVIPAPNPPSDWQPSVTLTEKRQSLSARLSQGGTLKIPGPEILAKAKRHQDADWGISKTVSSWPVDMSNMILKDKGIPAVLAHSIDTRFTDIPVTAIVERHIYAETGRNIIIPAGSRLIGTASGSVTSGLAKSEKVTISWERLIRPDGAAFLFSGTSADAQGRGGVAAYLDEQLFKKYANPFITTIFTAGINKLVDMNEKSGSSSSSSESSSTTANATTQQTYGQQTRQMFIDNFNDIFNEMMREANDVQPVLFVPSGTRLIVYPSTDLWLRAVNDDVAQAKQGSDYNSGGETTYTPPSWVDKRQTQSSEQNQNTSGTGTGNTAPEQVYTPPETDGTSPYDEEDALPDELLDRSMNPVVQGGQHPNTGKK